ncbi:hypothetical protein [Paenibacillus crassostreae]|uniref:Uncharacterized protein n=1 Tax=Paenibacillus crassostreae TaxID=1763538 RepID=A0A167AMD6_9BACL|nr:hypothetical protein [Paenibacillus crassostreae]AOZ92843.1 hypothetical protein LPB68_11890 [Paenibacillus crassostreae]OAB71201.1 hypothetical protein PNBC_20590 [Paenibacillus crassostreae]
MIEEKESSATFYQYKLIKKVPHPKRMNIVYWAVPCIVGILMMTLITWSSIFYFLLASPVVLWIHYVISRSVLLVAGSNYHKRWSFSIKSPWIGYMPNQYISYSLFRKVTSFAMWISLCVFLILLFWSPLSFITGLIFWHLWFLLPRLYTFMSLSGQRKDGMIKINPDDISYYKQ